LDAVAALGGYNLLRYSQVREQSNR